MLSRRYLAHGISTVNTFNSGAPCKRSHHCELRAALRLSAAPSTAEAAAGRMSAGGSRNDVSAVAAKYMEDSLKSLGPLGILDLLGVPSLGLDMLGFLCARSLPQKWIHSFFLRKVRPSPAPGVSKRSLMRLQRSSRRALESQV